LVNLRKLVIDEESLVATCAYIDLDPVAAGIVEVPEASRYTSITTRVDHGRRRRETISMKTTLDPGPSRQLLFSVCTTVIPHPGTSE
jgi:hypothetical protein